MKIFIIVGMPASGKNIARHYAEKRNLPYFATGDLVRGELSRRSLDPTPENTARLSTELRGEDGLGVTRIAISSVLQVRGPAAFLEGVRSWPEIDLIRRQAPTIVIAFLAPRAVRLKRILSRGRSDDSPRYFGERDLREISYGAAVPLALADEYILNTGLVEDALEELDSIVRRNQA